MNEDISHLIVDGETPEEALAQTIRVLGSYNNQELRKFSASICGALDVANKLACHIRREEKESNND